MVYGVVALSVLFLTVKGYCGKRTSNAVKTTDDALLFNLLRMLFCIAIVALFVIAENSLGLLLVENGMLAICLFAGVTNAVVLVGWVLVVKKCSLVSVDIGTTLGSIVPAVMCALFFKEAVSLYKMLGFLLILGATFILAGGKTSSGGKGSLLLPVIALSDGLSSFAQQLYKQFYTEAGAYTHGVFYPKNVYHFYTYVFTAVAITVVLAVYSLRQTHPQMLIRFNAYAPKIPTDTVVLIFVMAICLFAANYLQTVAASDYGMASQVLYPFIRGGCLITVNITGVLFGEKFTVRSVVGSLVALGGIIIMSIL